MRIHDPHRKFLHVPIDPALMREAKTAAASEGKLLHEFVALALSYALLNKTVYPKANGKRSK